MTRRDRLRFWASLVVISAVALAFLWAAHRQAGLEERLQDHADQEMQRILRESVSPPR